MHDEDELVSDGIPMRGAMVAPAIQTDRIYEFVKGKLSPKAKPKCKSFALAHLVPEGAGVLTMIQVDLADKATQEERNALARDIVNQLEGAANANASTHDRPQRYGVCAYGPSDVMIGRWDFLVGPPRGAMSMIGGETEPANGVGVLAQSMRFSEASMRMLVMANHTTMDRLFEENDRLRKRCTELEDRHMRTLDLTEQLVSRKHERDMQLEDKKVERAQVARLWSQFESMVPALMEKFGAGAHVTGKNSPLAQFLASLTVEQQVQIYGALTEEQLKQVQELVGATQQTSAH